MVRGANLIRRRRRALRTLRSERCVHFFPETGSPAVASRSSSSKVLRIEGLFFHPRPARSRPPDPSRHYPWGLVQFATTAQDAGATHPGDTSQQGDTAAATLPRQQTDEQPTISLVGGSHQAIDGPMLMRHLAVGVALAV